MNTCKKCGKQTEEQLMNNMCSDCYSIAKSHKRQLDFPYVINDKVTIYVDGSDYEKYISGRKTLEEAFHYLSLDELNLIREVS